jgi:exodeoxyribonuclease V gamma subunit
MNALDDWIFSTPLIDRARRDGGLPATLPADLVARGGLPLGIVGARQYEELIPGVLAIAEKVRAHLGSATPEARMIEHAIGDESGSIVNGRLRNVTPDAHVLYTYSMHCGRRLAGAWVRHLALQCAGIRVPTVLVCRKHATKLRNVSDPEKLLGSLVDLYWRGLQGPLLLFADAAYQYVEARDQGRDKAMAAAVKKFGEARGASSDRYVRRIFGAVDDAEPLAHDFEPFCERRTAGDRRRFPSFAELAESVFGPLLEHAESV